MSKTSPRQKISKNPSQKKKPCIMAHTCNPSQAGGIGRRIAVQGWPEQKTLHSIWSRHKVTPDLKNN
jgi:hypothetical protein